MDVDTEIEKIKEVCTDANGIFDKDQFLIRIVILHLTLHYEGVDLSEYYSNINKHLYRLIGPGYNLSSCLQFMEGKRGQATLNRVKDDLLKDMSPTLFHEIFNSYLRGEN
jgi:hypothetical protein